MARLLWIPLDKRGKIGVQVKEAIRKGLIKKQTVCSKEGCDSTFNVWAHHDDYAKPLKVRWLCFWCHHNFHEKRRAYILRSGRYPHFKMSKKQIDLLSKKEVAKELSL